MPRRPLKCLGGMLPVLSSMLLLVFTQSIAVDGFFLDSIQKKSSASPPVTAKDLLLQELDDPLAFNDANTKRTNLVAAMTEENPTEAPGSTKSFSKVATGTWRIVYAPHIDTMGKLFRGAFDPVYYIFKPNGEMTSHAKYSFPILGSGWLSVSGTYGSQDEDKVCRVHFDKAWVKLFADGEEDDVVPYSSLADVPSSPWKNCIQALGKFFFVDAVSVFPVSYLDEDTIVFDFELLGTRICARKGPYLRSRLQRGQLVQKIMTNRKTPPNLRDYEFSTPR